MWKKCDDHTLAIHLPGRLGYAVYDLPVTKVDTIESTGGNSRISELRKIADIAENFQFSPH